MMQTRDEAFQQKLADFVENFDAYYTCILASYQTNTAVTGNKYWARYDWEFGMNKQGPWPIRLEFRRPRSASQRTTGEAQQ